MKNSFSKGSSVKMDPVTKKNCPVCSSSLVEIFLEVHDIPVYCNVLMPTREEAVNVPRGDMQLGFCRDCGHVYNLVFNPELTRYTQAYENSLHFSPRFQEYAECLAKGLIERYEVHNKDVIEIGCGKGEFLELLCKIGDNRGIGFDASYVPDHSANAEKRKFRVIQDFYLEHHAVYKADFICCRHVLEHIQSPSDFLMSVRKSIGDRMKTVVYFEVPNVLYTLRDLGIWDLIYEHCSYFSSSSLSRLFGLCGFSVHRLSEFYDGQFLGIEASPLTGVAKTTWDHNDEIAKLSALVKVFSVEYRDKVARWRRVLEQMAVAGKRAVVWGGGSKGIMFLNALEIKHQIQYIVDINPRKQGMYTAGMGQKVVAPEFLRRYRADIVIVMNPIYENEVRHIVENLGLNPEYMFG
jgi:SAM-dependent methyltransferase